MGLKLDIKKGDDYGGFFVKEIIKTMSRKYGRYTYRIKCKCCPYEKVVESHALKKLKSCQFCYIYKKIGNRNGSLVFEEYLGKSLYKAKCDCGNYCSIRFNSTSHCGCKTKENKPASRRDNLKNPQDYIGKTYGLLKITKYLEVKENLRHYEAKCKCGKKISIASSRIGTSFSCGCLQKLRVPRGEKTWNSKHTEKDIMSLRDFYVLGIYSKKELMEMFNIKSTCLERVLKNQSWKHAIPKDFIPKIGRKIQFRSIDFIGKKINSWEILGLADKGKIYVKCQCGKYFIRAPSPIVSGKSKSCHQCSIKKKDYSYLIGKQIGSQKILTVYRKNKRPFGMVHCDCGNEREIGLWHILSKENCKCPKCYTSKIAVL
jgi:hypothetical protein